MKDLFLDIEALGKVRGSTIIQIGAVVFDPATGETTEDFQIYIQPEPKDPWTADLDTLEFHHQLGTFPHPPGIRDNAALPPGEAINAFFDFLADVATAGHEIDDVWSWGSTYDFPLLDPYWERYGTAGEAPWMYWQPSCARTVWKLAFPGVKHGKRPHHALDDCKAGVADLCAAIAKLTGNVAP